ncbi:hypothetical protein [Francisella persica]|nr:hypothetical protein [Francisella persica]
MTLNSRIQEIDSGFNELQAVLIIYFNNILVVINRRADWNISNVTNTTKLLIKIY